MKTIFESSRSFVLYSYTNRYGLLLFRSQMTLENKTRIDILFQDVRSMDVRMWFEGIKIVETDIDFIKKFSSNPTDVIEPGNKIYALYGTGWLGYIIGGIISFGEDDKSFNEKSELL